MRSITARLDRLEELVGVRNTKVVFIAIAGRYDEEIRAYISKQGKNWYRQDKETYQAFVNRIELEAEGTCILFASYE